MKASLRKIFSVMLLMLSLSVVACGVKSPPQPDFSRDSFAFGELSATLSSDGVVTVSGSLTGAFQNAEYFVLEMQPVDGELCLGCPFVPQDQYRIDSRDAWESESGSQFTVVYRPIFKADMYRWRVVGHNMYSGIKDVVSSVQTVGTESSYVNQSVPVPVVEQ
ncbi:MAG: hypothetical protein IJB29_04850 [Mailhella sp.]|nr:hypothetical protein [Mailhella sp.]